MVNKNEYLEHVGGAEREREAVERERNGERVSQKEAWAVSGKSAAHAPLTCSDRHTPCGLDNGCYLPSIPIQLYSTVIGHGLISRSSGHAARLGVTVL